MTQPVAVEGGQLFTFGGKSPRVAPGAYVAPTATLIGDVEVGEGTSIWFGAVLRGDFGPIRVGRGSSIQDNCVVHAAADLPTLIGDRVTIGHAAALEGCTIEDDALVGMKATVLQRALIGRGAMVAAGTVVTEGLHIPPHHLAAGVPARVKGELSEGARGWVRIAAPEYQALMQRYLGGESARVMSPDRPRDHQ